MAKDKNQAIKWLPDVEDHDYLDAESYLRLIFDDKRVGRMMTELRNAAIVKFKAKDIFRASQLSLLGVSNSHVERDRKKIQRDVRLSPLLLVRNDSIGRVVIADGYHRLCAIYEFDENASIHCKLI
jgi:hypothetical protein